jgi:hypothetical protein
MSYKTRFRPIEGLVGSVWLSEDSGLRGQKTVPEDSDLRGQKTVPEDSDLRGQKTVPEDSGLRGQMTDEFGRFAPDEMAKPSARFFVHPPA